MNSVFISSCTGIVQKELGIPVDGKTKVGITYR